jgi:hypothetical protein
MGIRSENIWTFKTARFAVYLEVCPDHDLDLSWDDDGSAREGLERGTLVAFVASVVVYLDGTEVAREALGGCIYGSAKEFLVGHRHPDPMNRNCTTMRAARGENVCICHYFPGMVKQAIAEARQHVASIQSVRLRAA